MKNKSVPFLLVLLLAAPAASGAKVYKFQDENGRWHFSDKPPRTERPVEVTQLTVDPKARVRLEQRGDSYKPVIYVANHYHGAVEVEVTFADVQNTWSKPALPRRFVARPADSSLLFSVYPKDPYQPWRYKLKYTYVPGDPNARHVPQAPYLPPVAPGSRFRISQAFNGPYSHNSDQNRYSVDIVMPVGTPVYAARDGVVMALEKDFFRSGTEERHRSRANTIRIVHDDGTMAIYAHLALENAQVYPGMAVKAGQLIAYSGNTGFTTGPHLHFAVQLNAGIKLESVPFEFLGEEREAVTPTQGMWLTGLVPPEADSVAKGQ